MILIKRLLLSGLIFFLSFPCAEAVEKVFFPCQSSAAEDAFKKAGDMTENKRWLEAAAFYQEIIEKYPDNICQISASVFKGARELAWEKLNALPPEGKDAYKVLVDPKARAIIEADPNSMESLEKIISIYLFSSYGADSLARLASYYLTQEEYQKATLYLSLFIKYGFGDEVLQQSITAKLGLCYFALGKEDMLLSLINWGQIQFKDKKITIGSNLISVQEYLSSLYSRINERDQTLNMSPEWPMLGGDESRSLHISSSFQIPKRNGRMESVWYKEIPKIIQPDSGYINEPRRYSVVGPPPFYPVYGEGTLFINNGKEIFAYSPFSQRLKWHYRGLIDHKEGVQYEQLIHSVSYIDGAVYANIEGLTPTQEAEHWTMYQIRVIIPERKLLKIDSQTGHVIWKVGDSKFNDEAFVNKASFMTPPVAWGGNLYIGATELSGIYNCYIVAVSPDQGKILWKLIICSSHQEHNMFGRTVREAVGSVVASMDGMVYYLTNMGAIASVNAHTGHFQWVYNYTRIPIPAPDNANFQTRYRPTTWYNSPLIVKNGILYAAPIDSDELYAIDADSGRLLWKRGRGDNLYLLGATERKVIIGGRRIEWLDGRTGKQLGDYRLLGGDSVAGLGVLAGDNFIVPGMLRLYKFDNKTFKLSEDVMWTDSENAPGHMAVAGQILFTGGQKGVNVFYDGDQVQISLKKEIEQNPKNPMPYLSLASIYLESNASGSILNAVECYQNVVSLIQGGKSDTSNRLLYYANQGLFHAYEKLGIIRESEGKLDEAFEFYQKAIQYAQNSSMEIEIKLKLYDYYSQNPLKNDKKMEEILLSLLNQYGHTNYQIQKHRISLGLFCLIQLASRSLEKGNAEKAIEYYQRILEEYPEEMYNWRTAREFATNEINGLIGRYGRAGYKRYDEDVEKFYKAAITDGSITQLERLISVYPNTKHIEKIILGLSSIYTKRSQYKKATETLRSFLQNYPKNKEIPKALYLLFYLYEKQKIRSAAKGVLRQIELEYKDCKIEVDGQNILLGDFVQEQLSKPAYKIILEKGIRVLNIWKGNEAKWKFEDDAMSFLRVLDIQGPIPIKYNNIFFLALGSIVMCYNSDTGVKLWEQRLDFLVRGVGFVEDNLVSWSDKSCFCLSPTNGAIIHQVEMEEGTIRGVALSNKDIAVTASREQSKTENTTVRYIDIANGKVVWSHNLEGRDAGDPMIGVDNVVVHTRMPANIHVYKRETGEHVRSFLRLEGLRGNRYLSNIPILVGGDRLYLVKESQKIEAYQLPSMELLWEYRTSSIHPLTLCGNEKYIIVTKDNNELTCLDADTGQLKWTWEIPQASSISQRVLDWDTFLVIEKQGDILQLIVKDGETGETKWKGFISEQRDTTAQPLLVTPDYIVCLSNTYNRGWNSQFLVFDKKNGKVIKSCDINEGVGGNTVGQMTIGGKGLIVSKDNIVWRYGD